MKNLFRIHLQQLQSSICYYLHFLALDPRQLSTGSCSLVLFSSLLKDSCYFAWLSDSNINSLRFILKSIKRFASTIYGFSPLIFYFLSFLAFVSSHRFSSLMPIITACHSTLYYMTADYLREHYPDFYDKHISLWECL